MSFPPRLVVLSAVGAVFAVGAGLAFATDPHTASELLQRSIAYHDPEGAWGRTPLTLRFEESRPDGSVRETEVEIDVGGESAAAGVE